MLVRLKKAMRLPSCIMIFPRKRMAWQVFRFIVLKYQRMNPTFLIYKIVRDYQLVQVIWRLETVAPLIN